MRFENLTPLPSALVPNADPADRMRVLAVCALSCKVKDEALYVASEQPPLLRDPRLPYPNDVFFMRERAIGVCASGFVYPKSAGDREADVRLQVGERTVRIKAFGRRVWSRGVTGLSPSLPQPIERIAMSWDNAFGGTVSRPSNLLKIEGEPAVLPAHEASFPLNPEGMGFSLSKEDAPGRPLPPLEDPDQLISRWDDYPEPVCLAPYPLKGGLRAGFVLKDGKVQRSELGRLASRAAPRTTFSEIAVGTRIELVGMRPSGAAIAFSVPAAPAAIRLRIGPDEQVLPLALDCIDIDAEAQSVRFVYRTTFGYDLIQEEDRLAQLEPMGAVELAPEARVV